jgi:peptide/nickel transport system permease protein
MVSHIVARTLRMATQLVAVSFLSFTLVGAVPGTFVDDLRLDPRMSPSTIDALGREYGLGQPLLVRYGRWLRGLTSGHLGYSLLYRVPVERVLVARVRNTLLLTCTALLVAWAFSLALGLAVAVQPGSGWDAALGVVMAGLLALPDLLIVLVLLVVATRWGWLSRSGMFSHDASASSAIADLAAHMAVPVAALSLSLIPAILQHVRQAIGEALPRPLAAALEARGLSPRRIVVRHALRLAGAPLVALAGVSFGMLLSASLVVEMLAGWPGVGPLMLEAVLARDGDLVVAVSVLSCGLLLIGNAVGDLALVLIDPRVRRPA